MGFIAEVLFEVFIRFACGATGSALRWLGSCGRHNLFDDWDGGWTMLTGLAFWAVVIGVAVACFYRG